MTPDVREAVARLEAWCRLIERPSPDGDDSLLVDAASAATHAADLRLILSALPALSEARAREALEALALCRPHIEALAADASEDLGAFWQEGGGPAPEPMRERARELAAAAEAISQALGASHG